MTHRRPRAFLIGLAGLAGFAACSAKASSPSTSPDPAPPIGVATVAAAATIAPGASRPDPREARLASSVLELLEHEHLLGRAIDDSLSRDAFARYLEELDAGKLFLLKSDRDALAKYRDKIDDELRSGSLELAHEGQKLFVARVGIVEKIVAELLGAPMNHGDVEYVELDPKKLEPAASDAELKDRWRQRLELEVMERVGTMEDRLAAHDKAQKDQKEKSDKPKPQGQPGSAPGPGLGSGAGSAAEPDDVTIAKIPATPELREAKARADLAKSYAARFARLASPGPLDAASDLINAVTTSLDPHTDYLPPADKANFDIAMSGSLEGIGAALREHDDLIEVSELVPGGAAWRQGKLGAGDLILAVEDPGKDPVDVVDMRLDDVVQLIRGPKGTVVRLRVRKPDGHEESIAITRDVIVIEESYARGAVIQKKGEPAYGYIHLPSFYGGQGASARKASSDIRKLLAVMNQRKVAGVVLDIRGNGGGLLGDAVELTGELIDHGPVVQVRDHDGKRDVLSDDKSGEDYAGPVVVMVDQFSASASEILAGALQDYHRAVIVGSTTHGKGTVQALANLDRGSDRPELGVLKLTIEQFFRVDGASTQREGVTPDIALPNPSSYIKSGERDLEHAIPWSKIDPAPHADWPATWNVPVLVTRSASRVKSSTLFGKINALTTILTARSKDTRVPLEKSQWEARRTAQKAEVEQIGLDLEKAPATMTVTVVGETPIAPQPGPSAKPDDRVAKWSEALSRDPWVDEAANVLRDMVK